jgi:hypothetical protein
MGTERGSCEGHDEIRPFLREVARRKPSLRKHYRQGYFTDGKKLLREYPRQKPDSEQMDFVESIKLNDQGLIQHYAVDWGWHGVNLMLADEYKR